jgi:hypothetical protein
MSASPTDNLLELYRMYIDKLGKNVKSIYENLTSTIFREHSLRIVEPIRCEKKNTVQNLTNLHNKYKQILNYIYNKTCNTVCLIVNVIKF